MSIINRILPLLRQKSVFTSPARQKIDENNLSANLVLWEAVNQKRAVLLSDIQQLTQSGRPMHHLDSKSICKTKLNPCLRQASPMRRSISTFNFFADCECPLDLSNQKKPCQAYPGRAEKEVRMKEGG